MRNKLILFVAILFFGICNVVAQSVVNAGGQTINSNDYVLEYSIGEVTITTLTTTDNTVTQGLLQPNIKVINPGCNIINDVIQYFSSPTSDILRVLGRHDWIDAYQIFTADGKLARKEKFFNNYFDLRNLAAGVYFIRLLPGCDNQFKTLKILKTTK